MAHAAVARSARRGSALDVKRGTNARQASGLLPSRHFLIHESSTEPCLITPTIGRKVWYCPTSSELAFMRQLDRDQMLDATVVYVHDDLFVNLLVIDHNVVQHAKKTVYHAEAPQAGCWSWMPYHHPSDHTHYYPGHQQEPWYYPIPPAPSGRWVWIPDQAPQWIPPPVVYFRQPFTVTCGTSATVR